MQSQSYTASLIAAATATLKKVNQDAFALAQNSAANLRAIITADGIGSHFKAEIGAQVAVASMREQLLLLPSPDRLDIPGLFVEARHRLHDHVEGIAGVAGGPGLE